MQCRIGAWWYQYVAWRKCKLNKIKFFWSLVLFLILLEADSLEVWKVRSYPKPAHESLCSEDDYQIWPMCINRCNSWYHTIEQDLTSHYISRLWCTHSKSYFLWVTNSRQSKSITQRPKVKALKFDTKPQNEFRHYTSKLSLTLQAVNCVFNVLCITDSYKDSVCQPV